MAEVNLRLPVTVVGVGPGDPGYLTQRAAELISEAQVVAGFRSVLAVAQPWIRGETLPLDYSTQDRQLGLLAERAKRGQPCVVCAWGDPTLSARELIERVRAVCGVVRVIPGISAVQIACVRADLAMEDCLLITLHRRTGAEAALEELLRTAREGRRHLVVLPRPWDLMPPVLAQRLIEEGEERTRGAIVYERLTLPGEREHRLTLGELAASDHPFSDLSLVVLLGQKASL